MRIFSLSLIVLLFSMLPAHAEVFAWKDSGTGLTLTYPDTWSKLNPQDPDMIISLGVPDPQANPVCNVRVHPEHRFRLYPRFLAGAVRDVNFSDDFWNTYLNGQYADVDVHYMVPQTGLGRGFGSAVTGEMSYIPTGMPTDAPTRRQAMVMMSHYYDKVYIADCSVRAEDYPRYNSLFAAFMDKIDFPKVYHEIYTGNYRNFVNE